ncbi:MAG: O-antigen ligase family protein [Patescibacteria group bacterium]
MLSLKTEENFKKILAWGICLLVFLLPWQTRLILKTGELAGNPWEYGTMSLYGLDILLAILVLFGLEYFVNFVFEKIDFKKTLWIPCAVLFFVWVCVVNFLEADKLFALYWSIRFFLVLFFGIVVWSVKPKLKYISLALLSAGTIQAILAIWQFISQQVIGCKWLGMASQKGMDLGVSVIEIADERWLRAYGSFSHPNILAGFLVLVILATTYLATNYKNPLKIKERYINPGYFNFFIPLLFIGLTLTFCRSAFVALVISLVALGIFIFIKNRHELEDFKKTSLVLVTCVIIFGIIFSSFASQRIAVDSRLEQKSLDQRQSQFEVSSALIQAKPILGYGVGNFTKAWHELDPNLSSWDYQPMHNVFLLILTETGLIGLLLFLATLFFKVFQNKAKVNRVQIFKFILLLAILILSFFDHYLWSFNSGLILWWLILGLV